MFEDIPEKWRSHVNIVASGCWEWERWVGRDGYGRLRPISGSKKSVLAHRFIYEHLVGFVPDGLEIDHLCRNLRCVNPGHLEAVTHWENMRRSEVWPGVKLRSTHCPNGHEWVEENTIRIVEGKRSRLRRRCRLCRNGYMRGYRKKLGL